MALILLATQAGALRSALSWRPLVWLGVVSYSVYLVHEPLVEAIDTYGLRWMPAGVRTPALLAALAAATAIAAGALFHRLVERPCLDPRSRARVEPRLARLFTWTDTLWDAAHRRLTPAPLQPVAGEESSSKPLVAG